MLNKSQIRKKFIHLRNSLSREEIEYKSQIIQKRLLRSNEFKKISSIGLYFPIGSEVRTDLIMRESKTQLKDIAFPKILKENIVFVKYKCDGKDEFIRGKYGIMEPASLEEIDIQLVVIPGISFDRSGNRIGYGKGYYDKFLQNHRIVLSFGLSFESQIFEDIIPSEDHDQKINALITERNSYYFLNLQDTF